MLRFFECKWYANRIFHSCLGGEGKGNRERKNSYLRIPLFPCLCEYSPNNCLFVKSGKEGGYSPRKERGESKTKPNETALIAPSFFVSIHTMALGSSSEAFLHGTIFAPYLVWQRMFAAFSRSHSIRTLAGILETWIPSFTPLFTAGFTATFSIDVYDT